METVRLSCPECDYTCKNRSTLRNHCMSCCPDSWIPVTRGRKPIDPEVKYQNLRQARDRYRRAHPEVYQKIARNYLARRRELYAQRREAMKVPAEGHSGTLDSSVEAVEV